MVALQRSVVRDVVGGWPRDCSAHNLYRFCWLVAADRSRLSSCPLRVFPCFGRTTDCACGERPVWPRLVVARGWRWNDQRRSHDGAGCLVGCGRRPRDWPRAFGFCRACPSHAAFLLPQDGDFQSVTDDGFHGVPDVFQPVGLGATGGKLI